MTRQPMVVKDLVPNLALRQAMSEYKQHCLMEAANPRAVMAQQRQGETTMTHPFNNNSPQHTAL